MFPKKKWLGKVVKKSSRIKILDDLFSKFIRLRDSDENGYCKCITCGNVFHWKEIDAGHFVSRDKKPTRWNEENVNSQCKHCNRFKSGEQYKHGIAIDKKYGMRTAEKLMSLGSARGSKIDSVWIEDRINYYRNKIKEFGLIK